MSGVAYFGGSFDPPHLGHHQIVEFLARSAELDKIYIMPTSQNPLKIEAPLFNNSQRKDFMQAWQKDLAKSLGPKFLQKIEFSFEELSKAGAAYTFETVQTLKKQHLPDSPFYLVLGEDSLGGLERWKNIEGLLKLLHSVWVFPRKSSALNPQLFPEILRSLCPVRWVNQQVEDVSSTEIRRLWLEHHEFHPHQLAYECGKSVFEIFKGQNKAL